MKMLAIALFSAVALFSQALAVSLESEGPLQGRDLFTPEWEVEVTPGGETVVLNGTIEEVHGQLLDLNPNWDSDFADDGLHKRESDNNDWTLSAPALEKRTDFSGAKYNCWGRWGSVERRPIWDGVEYLRKVKGKPRNGAGPSNCGRVSCSYNSAIYWCNDFSKTLNSFSSLADGAAYILRRCWSSGGPWSSGKTAGQVFHKTNWNVIVRSDKC